ncbi:MAG: electron transfer flavoprotein subunit beta/FixA family protein [Phycisphaerae bacterium]|nr:electron transfer flavoprotein subunit beta/FixA family protein [Phycisphaerae bacterium]
MPYNCVVLVKQVPDTKQISGKVMKDDGTVNRAALPAIFNPEDLNALELALQIKDKFGGTVTAVTMGLPTAAEVLRQSLFRGADDAVLITDRRCAASDTLATSYILSCAVKTLKYDIVLCGRQAIDGDTAQVGPQLAEKLGIPQISYVENLSDLKDNRLTVRRSIGNGHQIVRCKLPVLLTVLDTANEPRVNAAKHMMKHKKALTPIEIQQKARAELPDADEAAVAAKAQEITESLSKTHSVVKQWNLDDIKADLTWCGVSGSPTKVNRIQSVVLAAKEIRDVEPTEQGITDLIHELIQDNTIA